MPTATLNAFLCVCCFPKIQKRMFWGNLESEIASEQARSAALRDAFEGRRARYATAETTARNAELESPATHRSKCQSMLQFLTWQRKMMFHLIFIVLPCLIFRPEANWVFSCLHFGGSERYTCAYPCRRSVFPFHTWQGWAPCVPPGAALPPRSRHVRLLSNRETENPRLVWIPVFPSLQRSRARGCGRSTTDAFRAVCPYGRAVWGRLAIADAQPKMIDKLYLNMIAYCQDTSIIHHAFWDCWRTLLNKTVHQN